MSRTPGALHAEANGRTGIAPGARLPDGARITTAESDAYAFADGFLFYRTGNGDIVCWDLRSAPPPASGPTPPAK